MKFNQRSTSCKISSTVFEWTKEIARASEPGWECMFEQHKQEQSGK